MAPSSKSASKRASAAKRTSEATAKSPGATTLGEVDPVTRPGDPETHAANANKPSASEVAHAPASGTQRAEGGYPAGEYDITNPTKDKQGKPTNLPQPVTTETIGTASDTESLLAAHYALSGGDREALVKKAKEDSRMSDDERQAALEGAQVGFVLEHTGTNTWRCHVTGTNRFGHGATATEAIEAYLIGNQGSAIEQAAQAFVKLSPEQQKEIRERDRAAEANLAGSANPLEDAREAAMKVAQSDKKAARPAVNAASDGAERESARRADSTKPAKR